MTSVPRLVIAAPASGHGKTTVATGLMAALRSRGLTVSGHKAGPDYIDPGYHALATGRPGRNLDPVLCGEDLVAPLFAHGAAGADIAVVEGVMGLFDGRGATSFGSTAHVARLLAAPVVLVVDASAQGRSVAALVHGFASYDRSVNLAGVILNRAGSARHEEILREALAGIAVPVLGVLRRDDTVSVPSRHLGLVPAPERAGPAADVVARLAALVRGGADLDAVIAVARSAGPLPAGPWSAGQALAQATGQVLAPAAAPDEAKTLAPADAPASPRACSSAPDRSPPPAAPLFPAPVSPTTPSPPGISHLPTAPPATSHRPITPAMPAVPPRPVAPARPGPARPAGRPMVAVAGGPAFTFCYTETTELLTAAGAEVVTVDPLRDEALPPGTSALVIGGGFPEVHAAELSANEPLRRDVARLAASGAPVAAECAGLLYLARELDGRPMCGVIAATARMTGTLTLGYRDATAASDSVLAPAGTTVTGHEFHRTAVEPRCPATPAWTFGGSAEGFVAGAVHASFLHLHWAARPELARRLVEAAA